MIEKHGRQFASSSELQRFELFRCCSKCKQLLIPGQSILWNKENNGLPQHHIACPEPIKEELIICEGKYIAFQQWDCICGAQSYKDCKRQNHG